MPKPSTPTYYAVVPAAGVGSRMAATQPKQYLPLLGKTVLEHTLTKLLSEPRLAKIIVAVAAQDDFWQSLAVLNHPRIEVIEGGRQRSHSVLKGLQHLATFCQADDWVLVHDVARPCIHPRDIQKLMADLSQDAVGGILAVPVSDTIKQVETAGSIVSTVDRSTLWQAQTPQMFRYQLLLGALSNALDQGLTITDEASAIELAGLVARVVESSGANIKITRPEDLSLAEYYLQRENF